MAEQIADRRDIDFVLFDQLNVDELCHVEKFRDFNKNTFTMLINETRKFAIKEILPTYQAGDREGVRLENGNVIIPECYRRPFNLLREAEFTSITEDPEYGGQGVPETIATAAAEYLVGTNFAFATYSFLGHGTGKMIELFGTARQKELYLKKLYTAQWGGTMLLTEPNAGSDVGSLETTAKPNKDGTFTLTGNKIFITSGDHDLTENIIHPVLARIEGAPKGTKGISLFLVPKYRVNDDGSLGEKNDIVCTGVEEKMGIHGSATCSMALGSKGKCRGVLLGEENKGMKVMFHMMNEARLGVGLQSFAHASNAYLYALNYARERIQGRALEDTLNHAAPPVAIINHPDVRRMLLEMKSHVEGMRSFTYYVANCFDKAKIADTQEERDKSKMMSELLTPVLKTYNSQRGFDMCVKAIQVYGGAGYTKDYPVEQLARDCKIASIYEGTDGIQAMDLLGRKLGMNNGQAFMDFINEVKGVIAKAKEDDGLKVLADRTETLINDLGHAAMHLGTTAMSDKFKVAFAHSVPFVEVMGDTVMAWMLLWRANIASEKLGNGAKKKEVPYLEGQIKSADFFINNITPMTLGKIASIQASGDAAVTISDASF